LYVLLLFKILYFCFGNLYFKFGSEAGASAFLGIYISELGSSVLAARPLCLGRPEARGPHVKDVGSAAAS
jgi:hypothetical protein